MTEVRPAALDVPAPVTASRVPPVVCQPKGWHAHRRAVSSLLDSYRAVPPGSPVRLAKRTSNLFRPRAATSGPGLDVAGLDGVIAIDVDAATADVQGMCTYEHLVAATLRQGFMPYVVPQLKTITLGGAVTGLGIESSSFRNGLPHESVLEMDVLTGAGELLTVTPDGEHADLFAGFPNSYGSLGYAVRLRIRLQPVRPYVTLRNVRLTRLDDLTAAIGQIVATRSWEGEAVDFVDGVAFSPAEVYLVLGTWADEVPAISDYTGQAVYYLSLRDRGRDAMTVHDYLWRWDTDWFWCSKAFGAQNPYVRRVWPASRRRSDVYHRLVGLETRYGVAARIDGWRGRPSRERVIQDVEIPLGSTAEFLRWFDAEVGMRPVWLCPLRLREPDPAGPAGPADAQAEAGTRSSGEGEDRGPAGAQRWPLYPLRAGQVYVNVGFWGMVAMAPEGRAGDVNRRIEQAVDRFGGHKSLYSEAFYGEEDFWLRYGGGAYRSLKERYDTDGRLLDLYAKAVRRR